jgi:protein SERAC1
VDIIAVHGLDPLDNPLHATKTWSAANGNLWLKDFLPQRQPRTRVFVYGYNSSAVFGASTTGVNGAAENLLNYLRLERRLDQNRPIVWVSHSLGGLVVKKAIINAYVSGNYYKSIHDATRGVIFFGTPHRGGHHATLGDRMAKICRVVTGDVRNNIVEALRKDSMFASDINKDFARRAAALDLRVVNFIESLPIARHLGLVSLFFGLQRPPPILETSIREWCALLIRPGCSSKFCRAGLVGARRDSSPPRSYTHGDV